MTDDQTTRFDWLGHEAFDIEGADRGEIPLVQISKDRWRLGEGVKIHYKLATGLEKFVGRGDLAPETHEAIRTIDAGELDPLDLASVPGPIRWFARSYGEYTPAAIFHDHFITDDADKRIIEPEYADRYFRYQLGAVDVPRFKRYIMWAAVALRTRLKSENQRKRLLVGLWLLLAAAGIAGFVMSTLDGLFDTGMWFGDTATVFWVSVLAPWPLSVLWGKQYGAGLVAAAAALWLLPPSVLAVAGYGVYLGLEAVTNIVFGDAEIADAKTVAPPNTTT